MNRLTYKLNAEEQKEYRSRYIQFEYLPIPDYDIKRGNYDRISTDMIYNKLGKIEDLLDQYNVKDLEELDKLLTMATSYEELSKQIGCPLEVRVKIFTGAKVYDSNGTEYEVQYVYENEFMATDGSCDDNGSDNEYYFQFNEYNQFWWLDNGEKESNGE